VEKELKQIIADDIIEPVKGPVSWVSPLVIVNKPKQPGKIRLVIDSRCINRAILRQHSPVKTLDDIIHQLNGSSVYSKLDLRSAFEQIQLHKDSRPYTAFSSHIGLFMFMRLCFGLNVSSEIFQTAMSQVLNGIPGVIQIVDDCLIYGATAAEHDAALDAVINRLLEYGLTLHKEKCILNQPEIEFFGCVFSARGVSIHPDRLRALDNLPPPKSGQETASLLGMFGYISRHMKNFATVAEPLRKLTRSGTVFRWSDIEQKSCDALKACMRENITTSYFCPSLHTTIHCDGASRNGIAATLTQTDPVGGHERVICHVSRRLTDTEQRYSQLEVEALSVVFGCERMHSYVFGGAFDLVTECRSL